MNKDRLRERERWEREREREGGGEMNDSIMKVGEWAIEWMNDWYELFEELQNTWRKRSVRK